jgi:hypothetical protein
MKLPPSKLARCVGAMRVITAFVPAAESAAPELCVSGANLGPVPTIRLVAKTKRKG